MRQKGVIYIWVLYWVSRFGSSADARMPLQEALAKRDFSKIDTLKNKSEDEIKALLHEIRGAARDYYFKGRVPVYYKDILRTYRRSVLYHILYQRNFD